MNDSVELYTATVWKLLNELLEVFRSLLVIIPYAACELVVELLINLVFLSNLVQSSNLLSECCILLIIALEDC